MTPPNSVQVPGTEMQPATGAPVPTSFPDPLAEPTSVPVDATVHVRNESLVVLAVLASLFTLHWAAAVFVPLLLGLMFSYALAPLVNRMTHIGLPRTLAAALLLAGIIGSIGSAV
jgi:hypothetical protein